MGYDIFVSSSTTDKLFADALVQRLEQLDYRCWYAPRDLASGVERSAAIAQALNEVSAMLLLFSAQSNSSDETPGELALAASNNITVIPVRTEDVAPGTELECLLSNRHWLDVCDMVEVEAAVNRVVEGLGRYDDLFPGREATARKAPEPSGEDSARPAADEHSASAVRRISLGKFLLAALVVAVVAVAGVFYFSERPEIDPQAHLLHPAENAGVFVYGGGPVTALVMRLAPLPEGEGRDEFLVTVWGTDSRLDGRLYRCVMVVDPQMRFRTTIDGHLRELLAVNQAGEGFAYSPDSGEEFALRFIRRDDAPATMQSLMELYRAGKRWEP